MVVLDAEKLLKDLREARSLVTKDIEMEFNRWWKKNENFTKLITDLHKKSGQSFEDFKASYIGQTVFTLINRLLFLRICEDKGFLKEKFTPQGLSRWFNFQRSLSFLDLVEFSFKDMARVFSGLYEPDEYSILLPADNTMERLIDMLNDHPLNEPGTVLGDVYEKFMDKEERKRLGQFYTPDFVIKYILENTLLEKFKEKDVAEIKLIDPACGSGHFLTMAYDMFKEEYKKKYPGLSDAEIHRQILENNIYGVDVNPFAVQLTLFNLMLKNLDAIKKTGVPKHNIICADSLRKYEEEEIPAEAQNFDALLEYQNSGSTLPFDEWLYQKIFKGSEAEDIIKGITGETRDKIKLKHFFSQKFDCVVGNPPYHDISQEYVKKELRAWTYYAEIMENLSNISSLFIKRGIDLLMYEGFLGLLLPKTVTRVDSHQDIRIYASRRTKFRSMVDCGLAFEDVRGEQIIFVGEKRRCKDTEWRYPTFRIVKDNAGNLVLQSLIPVPRHHLEQLHLFPLFNTTTTLKIALKLSSMNPKLGDKGISDIFMGLGLGAAAEGISLDNPDNSQFPLLFIGNSIGRFYLRKKYRINPSKLRPSDMNKARHMARPKIIAQRIYSAESGVIATYDSEGALTLQTVTNVVLKDPQLDPLVVLAILNSRFASYFLTHIKYNNSLLSMDLVRPYLGALPLPKLSPYLKRLLGKHVSTIITLFEKLQNIDINLFLHQCWRSKDELLESYQVWIWEREETIRAIQNIDIEIDKTVYELYDLKKEEICDIETQLRARSYPLFDQVRQNTDLVTGIKKYLCDLSVRVMRKNCKPLSVEELLLEIQRRDEYHNTSIFFDAIRPDPSTHDDQILYRALVSNKQTFYHYMKEFKKEVFGLNDWNPDQKLSALTNLWEKADEKHRLRITGAIEKLDGIDPAKKRKILELLR